MGCLLVASGACSSCGQQMQGAVLDLGGVEFL